MFTPHLPLESQQHSFPQFSSATSSSHVRYKNDLSYNTFTKYLYYSFQFCPFHDFHNTLLYLKMSGENRYNTWVEKLRGEWEGGATAYAGFLHLNISYKLLWVIGISFLWGKLLYSFVDSCSAVAWERNKHNREVTLKLNCISWRETEVVMHCGFSWNSTMKRRREINCVLAKVTENNTPRAMLLHL